MDFDVTYIPSLETFDEFLNQFKIFSNGFEVYDSEINDLFSVFGKITIKSTVLIPLLYLKKNDITYEYDESLNIVRKCNDDSVISDFISYLESITNVNLATVKRKTLNYGSIHDNILMKINGIDAQTAIITSCGLCQTYQEYFDRIEFYERWISTSEYSFFSKEAISIYISLFPFIRKYLKIVRNNSLEARFFKYESRNTSIGIRLAEFIQIMINRTFGSAIQTSTGLV